MTQTIHATYDGQVLRPEEPVSLPPNTRVRVTIESEPVVKRGKPYSALDAIMGLNLQLPPDASSRVDEYLYGERVSDE